ncbi:MAG: hypothetical protein ABJQ71_19875 [Roseibium sp.]
MAARNHPVTRMAPSVTVLQLDTEFPRVPGDVGCKQTYVGDIEIIRIANATVGQIVSSNPATIPIAPFEAALTAAKGEVVVTSCGFLSYWQTHLQSRTDKPFISSALTALHQLCNFHVPHDILTLTFDASRLNAQHFGPYETDVIGLPTDMHLRQVISQNLTELDVDLATREVTEFVMTQRKEHHKHILLECTNLPPYKDAIGSATDLPITDILTGIEGVRQNTIRPAFLTHQWSNP